jgi:hypothetical protein
MSEDIYETKSKQIYGNGQRTSIILNILTVISFNLKISSFIHEIVLRISFLVKFCLAKFYD